MTEPTIMIVDWDGVVLTANQTAKNSFGQDPTGKSLFDLFSWNVAKRQLANIRKAITEKKTITYQDGRNYRHFLTHYFPIADACIVMATEITEIVRIQKGLEVTQKLRRTTIHSKNIEELADATCRILYEIEGVKYVKVTLKGLKPVKPQVEPETTDETPHVVKEKGKSTVEGHTYNFELTLYAEKLGKVSVVMARELTSKEVEILKTTLDDLAYKIKLAEMRNTLIRNMVEIAYLIDGIRNPLAAIALYTEMNADETLKKKVGDQVERILTLTKRLDMSWQESEKIVKALKIHPS